MAVTQQKIKIYDSHIFQVKKMIEKCKITNREIDSLNPNHKTYRLLGELLYWLCPLLIMNPRNYVSSTAESIINPGFRFFLSDKERIKTDLENSVSEQEKEISEYQVSL